MGAAAKRGWIRRFFTFLWRAVTFVEQRLGIAGAMAVGLVLIVFGMLLNATLAGMVFGIPATLFGALLLLRALY